MPYSTVQICNMALSRIGSPVFIADINETTREARMCAQWYDPCRGALLEEMAWPFATKCEYLALVTENPNDEWVYAYRYPSDAVRLNRMLGSINMPINYEIMGDADGRLILTNETSPRMWYNANETSAGKFSSWFADALSWRIAKEISTLAKAPTAVSERAHKEYMLAMAKAAGHGHSEYWPRRRDAKAISVR